MSWHSSCGVNESTGERFSLPLFVALTTPAVPGCMNNQPLLENSDSASAAQAGACQIQGDIEEYRCQTLSCFGKYEGVECACLSILARLILVFLALPELHGLLLCQVKWRWSLFGGFLRSVSWAYSRVIVGVRWSLSGCSCQDKETGCQNVTERLDFLWCCLGCSSRGNTGKLIPKHSRRTSSASACSRQSWGL